MLWLLLKLYLGFPTSKFQLWQGLLLLVSIKCTEDFFRQLFSSFFIVCGSSLDSSNLLCQLKTQTVVLPNIHCLAASDAFYFFSKLPQLPPIKGCVSNEANAIDYRRKQGHWLKAHVVNGFCGVCCCFWYFWREEDNFCLRGLSRLCSGNIDQ